MSFSLRKNAVFLVCSGAALVLAAYIWLGLPHEREVTSLWVFLLKLLPFVFAVEAIARLDVEWFGKWRLVRILVPLAFVVYFLYFVPKIFYYMDDHPNLYYHLLTLTPFLILTFVLAYRLGGGGATTVRRLAYGLLLIMLSGAEDLAFLTVNDHRGTAFHPIPEVWEWASHMAVRLGGHYPTKEQAYVFIAVHLIAAGLVLFAPGKWFRWLIPRRFRREAGPAD